MMRVKSQVGDYLGGGHISTLGIILRWFLKTATLRSLFTCLYWGLSSVGFSKQRNSSSISAVCTWKSKKSVTWE